MIFEALLTRNPPPPSTVRGDIPAEFDRLVAKALEKVRDVRYQTAVDMRGDLARLKRSSESGMAAHAGTPQPAPSSFRLGWKPITAGAAVVVAAIAGVFVSSNSNRTGAFSERDSVVLADFTNNTGEPVFDDTLKEALEVQLRQSPFLSVLPEQRVQGTLRLMGRKSDEADHASDRARHLRADRQHGDDRRRDRSSAKVTSSRLPQRIAGPARRSRSRRSRRQ